MIRRIDDFILDHAQPIADWVHEWTGLDCIQQAKVMHAVAATLWLVMMVGEIQDGKGFSWLTAFCVVSRAYLAFFDSDADSQARSTSSAARNPRRIMLGAMLMRLLWGYFCVTAIVFLFWKINTTTYLVFALFSSEVLQACDVQTPRLGRIREGLRNMGQRLIPMRRPRRSDGVPTTQGNAVAGDTEPAFVRVGVLSLQSTSDLGKLSLSASSLPIQRSLELHESPLLHLLRHQAASLLPM